MNIYITPQNEQRLRMWRNMGPGRSMSGLINELLSTRFGDPDFRPTDQEEQIVAEDTPNQFRPLKKVIVDTADVRTVRFCKHNTAGKPCTALGPCEDAKAIYASVDPDEPEQIIDAETEDY